MKILITGGCGNIGKHVVEVLSEKGHQLRVVDRDAEELDQINLANVETIVGDISDRDLVFEITKGMDAIVHLAWSFSPNSLDLFDIDVKGYIHLLDAAVEHGIEHVVNTSTAVTYGKPQVSPVDETHPRLVEQSRNPMYALAKQATEKLTEIYASEHGLAANTIMIWYAYGHEIGGRYLRGMVKDAIQKGKIDVPKDCGGSFLQLDDFISGLERIFEKKPKGEMFNLATIYLTWEQLADIIVSKANPDAKVVAIDPKDWTEGQFLTDDWNFSTEKAERMLGYQSHLTNEQAIKHLGVALEACVAKVREKL
ncbi:epimerase [Ammoniphilus oxalaticus]|uniref:Epimerase n=1 Tax=Ammoniphilus oxalaticus TaxID=66863 RepID=A0A419SNY2_9BACL|nr:NAD(P)-dependent oxidoreductase [Ammoniphilus oxalaticus]RKD25988.1 epimerase [Ammoniphilus oxalaticus]